MWHKMFLATAIFLQQDPLAEKYYNISPYAYCANNPVNFVDPDGKFPFVANLLGAVLSVAVEYGCQVAANKSLSETANSIIGTAGAQMSKTYLEEKKKK